jgi:hypothetical protein
MAVLRAIFCCHHSGASSDLCKPPHDWQVEWNSNPRANPTSVSYNTSLVKIYNATNSVQRF